MATSTVPAFLAALVDALADPVETLGAAVHYGPPISDEHADYVAVAYSENGAAVSAEQSAVTLQNGRNESYAVAGQVVAASGDTDMAATTERAFALFAVVEDALRADWTVDGTQTFAEVATYELTTAQTTNGAVAVVDFVVVARISPL